MREVRQPPDVMSAGDATRWNSDSTWCRNGEFFPGQVWAFDEAKAPPGANPGEPGARS